MSLTEAAETAPETETNDSPSRPSGPWLGDVGLLVSRRAGRLQKSRSTSATTAMLARLRSNVGAPPGADPSIWSVTIDRVSDDARGDDPTPEEVAVHVALTLYAVNQQSRDSGAHRPGVGLGHAVSRLERARGGAPADQDEGKVSPVRRRFDAVVTASSISELTYHLRGLVTLMRAEDVGLDYGLLADDLLQYQQAGGQDIVRRRWGRQLYRLDRPLGDATTNDTTTSETIPLEENQ
ncbi:type I-E CRISPR-associated protein Cse2/CasB [Oerskovia enterophila]|uniref:type I-E CRISPR-associated protein Cse2/CasB n=1 Tax=Oerskovia enterophila TaxID=43678 RepID=UPI003393318C